MLDIQKRSSHVPCNVINKLWDTDPFIFPPAFQEELKKLPTSLELSSGREKPDYSGHVPGLNQHESEWAVAAVTVCYVNFPWIKEKICNPRQCQAV